MLEQFGPALKLPWDKIKSSETFKKAFKQSNLRNKKASQGKICSEDFKN